MCQLVFNEILNVSLNKSMCHSQITYLWAVKTVNYAVKMIGVYINDKICNKHCMYGYKLHKLKFKKIKKTLKYQEYLQHQF